MALAITWGWLAAGQTIATQDTSGARFNVNGQDHLSQDKSRPDRIAPRTGGGTLMLRVALHGWNLAPGMAPTGRPRCSNYFSELEPRYGIEP